MTEYGLPHARDGADDEPAAVEHTFDWADGEVTIELVPPTLEQMKQYQNMGDDVAMDRLEAVVDRHIERPDVPAAKMTMEEVNCYVQGIMNHANRGGDDFIEEAREKLQEMAGEGNGTEQNA